MTAPLDSDWANTNISDSALNGTTHGSGTTAERTAIGSWPANRPFFDTTLDLWYYNSHASAPSSVTWTRLGNPESGTAEGDLVKWDNTAKEWDKFTGTNGQVVQRGASDTSFATIINTQSDSLTSQTIASGGVSTYKATNLSITVSTKTGGKFLAVFTGKMSNNSTAQPLKYSFHDDAVQVGTEYDLNVGTTNMADIVSGTYMGDLDGSVIAIYVAPQSAVSLNTILTDCRLDIIEIG